MSGIKGTNKELYAKKSGISTLSTMGKRTDISYENIKRIEYLFAQDKQPGYIVFISLTNQAEKVEFKQETNDEILSLVNTLKKKFPDIDYEEHEERMYHSGLNIFLLISLVIGILYLIYSLFYWSGAFGGEESLAGQIGIGIATALVAPHLIVTALAALFNALGLFMRKRAFALTGAILYTVAVILFPLYFMFVIIEVIFSFIGFAKMSK